MNTDNRPEQGALDETHEATSTTAADHEFRWPSALLGAVIALVGISGLLDDTGLIRHPWWIVLVISAIGCCLFAIASTTRSLTSRSA